MKKYFFITVVLLITILSVIAADDFATALKKCSSYTESGVVNTEGMSVQTTKQILGWSGDRCVYKEKMNFAGMNITTTCKLSGAQITELTSVMNAYSLVQKYSNEKADTSSFSKVQDNPVVKVWNKYLQDPSTCSIDGLDSTKTGH